MSAWLPSRRSVESHRGAAVIFLSGQVRSGTVTGSNAVYRWYGIPLGCWVGMVTRLSLEMVMSSSAV
jgi:hypothetical protein